MAVGKPKPPRRYKRVQVSSSIDDRTKLTLQMLGFDIPRLIEELLVNVVDQKKCPCCGRQVKPLITGRKVTHDQSLDISFD